MFLHLVEHHQDNLSVGVATVTGFNVSGITTGQFLQHDGSSFVGIASTGFRDYVIDQGQGYYAYTTDFYTVGVANTTQEIEEGEWTLLQPQVAAMVCIIINPLVWMKQIVVIHGLVQVPLLVQVRLSFLWQEQNLDHVSCENTD